MGLFERLSGKGTKEREEELTDIHEEMLNMHNKLERLDSQLAQFKEVDQQLQEAVSIKKSAAMVAEKLEEVYRDVQLVSEAIRKDDKEMRNYILQQVDKMELIARNVLVDVEKLNEQVRMELSADYQKEVTSFKKTFAQSLEQFQQEMKQQTENQLQTWDEHVREEQKKHEQALADLKKELLQKEKLWQRQMKQRDLMFIAAFLLLSSLSLWALWN